MDGDAGVVLEDQAEQGGEGGGGGGEDIHSFLRNDVVRKILQIVSSHSPEGRSCHVMSETTCW